MARPRKTIEITPEQFVETLAAKQCTKLEIAAKMNISIDTFDRRYAEIYDRGRQVGRSKLREKLFDTALAGNSQVLIFCSKSILGLKETSAMELSGPDGQPIQTESNARERLTSLLSRTAAREGTPTVPGEPDQSGS